MNKQICEEKVAELTKQVEAIVREKAMTFYSCWCVNRDLYDDDSYRLPRILISAAIKDAVKVMNPITAVDKKFAAADKKLVEELVNF